MSTQFQNAARIAMKALLGMGGAYEVTYRRQSGETLTTYAVEDKDLDDFGAVESGTAEWRTAFDLLREAVGEPCRGDTLVLSDGSNYTVQDLVDGASDTEIVRVTVK